MDAMVEPLRASSEVDAAPDWSVVPFAVACARCGHDLHGRSEPTCPGCALTFRWADAVPIEQLTCTSCGYHLYGLKVPRCPECATEFTWGEALANYHRQRKPLFEYQWRTKPVRSLFYTWWLALRPKKLWTTVDIHDPVRWKPLLALVIVNNAFGLLFAIGILVVAASTSELWRWRHSTGRTPITWSGAFELPIIYTWHFFKYGLIQTYTAFAVFWYPSLVLSHILFQHSMRRYRIRSAHILRMCCLGSTALLSSVTMTVPVVMIGCHFVFPRWTVDPAFLAIGILFGLFSVWHSIGNACRSYLHVDWPFGMAAAGVIIATLLTATIALLLLPKQYGEAFLWTLLDSVGL